MKRKVKKRFYIFIFFIIFCGNSSYTLAQKAPDGFLGIKWGTTREEFKKIILPTFANCPKDLDEALEFVKEKKSNFLHLRPPDDKYAYFHACGQWEKIGDSLVTRYFFSFSNLSKDEFYSVTVWFPKDSSFNVFLKALTEKYGDSQYVGPLVLKINPNAKVGMIYQWIVENKVSISLQYDDMEKSGINGSLTYTYLPIWNQINAPKDIKKTKDKL